MPRRKTVQPAPLETFTCEDGLIIEVRDENCAEIGRGLHKRNVYETKRNEVVALVAKDYLSPAGPKTVPKPKDYMRSAASFSKQVTRWGISASGDHGDTLLLNSTQI